MNRAAVKELLGPRWTVRARCLMRGKPLPRWGNLRRTRPLSDNYGFDRGTPIDRYYLHQFLAAHAHEITGRVLEIQQSDSTRRYGTGVTVAETIDINPRFNPTFVCDLAQADRVPADRYDCVLLPNTLHHLRDVRNSMMQMLRVLKPTGSLIATACGFVPLISDGSDYWRLSEEGWREVMAEPLRGHFVQIDGHGNCLSAVAALVGVAAEELKPAELDEYDCRYPVLITLHCRKSNG
jgi:SAM-dependent methyltransferase